MKFYESGDNRKPVIFLFPGTCCLYSSFDHVLDGLHSYFYTVAVSYDGFDPNEKTEFYSMEDECEKIDQETNSLRHIKDGFPKIVIVGGLTPSHVNTDGISIINIIDFLKDTEGNLL